MAKVVLLVVAVAALAQVFPACEGTQDQNVVIGWVEAKHFDSIEEFYVVEINHIEYQVPSHFYQQVKIGDLVKWDGMTWTIVRRGG